MPIWADPGGGSGGGSYLTSYTTGWVNQVANLVCYVGIYRNGILLTQFGVDTGVSPIFFSDTPPAGSHNYEVRFMNSTNSGKVAKFMLQAMEIKR